MFLPAFEYYPRDLNNAATSRRLVNPAVIFIFHKQLQICIAIYFVLTIISLILNSFYNTTLFDKKVSLFNCYAIRVGLNSVATSRILVNPAVILIL